MIVKSLKIGILINFLITFSIGILTFVVNKYFATYMGAKDLGLMRFFTQLIAYLSLAEMGLGTASTYALYKPLAEKNYEKINIIISTIESIYKKIAFSVLILGFILSPGIKFFLNNDIILNKEIYFYWCLYVLNTALSYSFAKYIILFTANQQFEIVRIVQGLSKIISQSCQIIVLLKYQSFFYFILFLIVENLIQYIVYKSYYKKQYIYIKKVKTREKKISKDLFNLFWHKIGELIVFNTDYIIIAKFLSLKMVGIYSSYLIITNLIGTLIGIVTNVINPKIGNFISRNTKEDIYELWKRLNVIFIFIGVILTYITFKLINPFINLWLGKEYLLSSKTVSLLMINLFIKSSCSITGSFKNGCGYFNDIHLPVLESLLNLSISLILVNYIGIDGVIIGTIVSNITIIFLARPILLLNKYFDRNWKNYIKMIGKYLLLGILTIIFSEIITTYFIKVKNIVSWKNWIGEGIKLAIIVISIGILFFSFNKEFRKNLKIIKK